MLSASPKEIDFDRIHGLVVYASPVALVNPVVSCFVQNSSRVPRENANEEVSCFVQNSSGVPRETNNKNVSSFVVTSSGLIVSRETKDDFFDKIGFGKDSIQSLPENDDLNPVAGSAVLVTGYEDSDYVRIDICRDIHSVSASGGGTRGEINQFSRESRKRMLDTLCKLRAGAGLPQFVTLTYPGEFSHDAKVWKSNLDLFGKRLITKYPESSAIWKLEPQTRGAPHFHLIVYGVPFDKSFKEWLSLAWFEVVGSGDIKHLRAGTNAQAARSLKGVKAYASKRYMGKELSPDELKEHAEKVAGWASPGRFWGVINRKFLPVGRKFVERIEFQVDSEKMTLSGQSLDVVRAARKIYQRKSGRKVYCSASSIALYVSADLFRRFVVGVPCKVLNRGAVIVSGGFSEWSKSDKVLNCENKGVNNAVA